MRTIHFERDGLVFNSDGRKLHAAACSFVATMQLGTRKLHFTSWPEARYQLELLYGPEGPDRWVRCPRCGRDSAFGDAAAAPTAAGKTTSHAESAEKARPLSTLQPLVDQQTVRHHFAAHVDAQPGVYLWSSHYIPYPPRSQDLESIAQKLRAKLRSLTADGTQVLHAVYAGPKGSTTDVENNLFYNVHQGSDALRGAGNGVRFEWWPDPPASVLRGHRCRYAYCLAEARAGFAHWRVDRQLARWPPIDLGRLGGDKKLEAVWHALRTSDAVIPNWPPRDPMDRFGLDLQLSVPAGRAAASASFVKNLVDGVISAFHHDPGPAVAMFGATRVALALQATGVTISDVEVAELLLDDSLSVLGPRPGLRTRTRWQPYDEDCVAVQLDFVASSTASYSFSGALFAVAPATL